ncbi:F-box/RNI-like/fbd-like domains-containing protein [Abeliophyllum distichum]|uniref:F-box/RNI-like/fbd-like domains-containing protein n=1 Tax=Abeliophyllum distichum TaxID=126358 RepID=A0ABD1QJP3_9LAMI
MVSAELLYGRTTQHSLYRGPCSTRTFAQHQCLVVMATSVVLKRAKQQRLHKSKNEDGGEDLISKLPDAILHYILSFLPTKEIIRTSIVCKRWQYLWTAISNIDLEESISGFDIMKSDYPKCQSSFVNSVERILLLHDDSDIKRLRLSFESWILHLSLVTFVNQNSTQQLFSSCPLLQELALVDCRWENIKHINISIPTLSCLFGAEEEEVAGRCIRMLSGIQSTRSLVISDETLECLSDAENISSDLPVYQNLIHLKVVGEMSSRTIEILLDLMQNSPNLEFIDIAEGLIPDEEFIEDDWNFEVMPCCLESSLKILNINVLHGQEAPMHLLKYFLKHSTVLERAVICCPSSILDDMRKREEFRNQLLVLPRSSENCAIEVLDRSLLGMLL